MLAPWKKGYDQPRQLIIKQRHYFADKGPSSQSYGFSSSYVWMWEFNHKESWALKIDAFELWHWRRLLRVSWTARWSNQSILKDISPEYSLKGLMLKLKLQCFGHLMWRTDPDAGKYWRQEKRMTEDEMVGWHHQFDEHEYVQALVVSDGQGSLACYSPWGHRKARRNWIELIANIVAPWPPCLPCFSLCFSLTITFISCIALFFER